MTITHARPAALARAACGRLRSWRLHWLIQRELRRYGVPSLPETRCLIRAAVQNLLTSSTAHSPQAMQAYRQQAEAAVRRAHDARQARALTRTYPWARGISPADLAEFAAEPLFPETCSGPDASPRQQPLPTQG